MRKIGAPHAVLLAALAVTAYTVRVRSAEPATRAYDAAECGPVRDQASAHSRARVKEMIVCLLNYERRRHGLSPLVVIATLDTAAQVHSDDMVARSYFEHVTPDGIAPQPRIEKAGFVARPSGMTGENIAWGEGVAGTPASVVDAWMHSPGHRANILRSEFTGVGVGVKVGAAPVPGDARTGSATFTTDFGG